MTVLAANICGAHSADMISYLHLTSVTGVSGKSFVELIVELLAYY